jgi:hypothetical protein
MQGLMLANGQWYAPMVWSLNMPLKDATSNYIRHVRPTLAAFVDLLCGQTSNDYGSNKVLLPAAF